MSTDHAWTACVAAFITIAVADKAAAQKCSGPNAQECSSYYYNYSCYKLSGPKWCQKYYYSACDVGGCHRAYYTETTVHNHSSYSVGPTAWGAWNYPPNGPDNSFLYYDDGSSAANHDIDIWNTYDAGSWGGSTSVPSTNGCFNRGQGAIYINTRVMNSATYSQLLRTFEHELGHGLGLGHTCYCPTIMDPCLCSNSTLTLCDGQGAAALYPVN